MSGGGGSAVAGRCHRRHRCVDPAAITVEMHQRWSMQAQPQPRPRTSCAPRTHAACARSTSLAIVLTTSGLLLAVTRLLSWEQRSPAVPLAATALLQPERSRRLCSIAASGRHDRPLQQLPHRPAAQQGQQEWRVLRV